MNDAFFRFADRTDAGRQLAERLAQMPDIAAGDPVVYALPRGGVPVAAEVARQLNAPLDLLLVRKIGAPGNPELAVAAIAEGAETPIVVNNDIQRITRADDEWMAQECDRALAEIDRRRDLYLADNPRPDVTARTAIIVDDGLATGATMKVALLALKHRRAARVIVALPVAARDSLAEIETLADRVVCLHRPQEFFGVGAFYRDFRQLTDAETCAILDQARRGSPAP